MNITIHNAIVTAIESPHATGTTIEMTIIGTVNACPHCEAPLPSPEFDRPIAPMEPGTNYKRCPNCNKSLILLTKEQEALCRQWASEGA